MSEKLQKLKDVSTIITGLPIFRYRKKDDVVIQKIIGNISIEEIDNKFPIETEKLPEDIDEKFISKEHDILYKIQQKNFAKEITTETGMIIPNTYFIIRTDTNKVNPTYLTNYLNNPQVKYEITRQIESSRILKVNKSILEKLQLKLPAKEKQDDIVELINNIDKRIQLKNKSIENDKKLINSLFDKDIGDIYD